MYCIKCRSKNCKCGKFDALLDTNIVERLGRKNMVKCKVCSGTGLIELPGGRKRTVCLSCVNGFIESDTV